MYVVMVCSYQGYNEWSECAPCNVGDEFGAQSRTRECTVTPPDVHSTELFDQECRTREYVTSVCLCDVAWSHWGPCDCITGTQIRTKCPKIFERYNNFDKFNNISKNLPQTAPVSSTANTLPSAFTPSTATTNTLSDLGVTSSQTSRDSRMSTSASSQTTNLTTEQNFNNKSSTNSTSFSALVDFTTSIVGDPTMRLVRRAAGGTPNATTVSYNSSNDSSQPAATFSLDNKTQSTHVLSNATEPDYTTKRAPATTYGSISTDSYGDYMICLSIEHESESRV